MSASIRRIASVLFTLLFVVSAHAQTIKSGHVLGNGTASERTPTDTPLRPIMQQSGIDVGIPITGAVHDGVTDDAAAINSALATCSAAGGGVVLIGPYTYLVNSANISIPSYCALKGQFSPGGAVLTNAYGGLPYTLLLNPSFTIQQHRNSGLLGVAVVASTLPATQPSTVQAAATAIESFSGTAITLGPEGSTNANNGNDITLRDLFIIGFNQCILQSWADRARGFNIFGDCTNGLSINQSNDVSRYDAVHFWPYFTQNNASNNTLTATVSGATSSGGKCEIQTSSPHGFAAGNYIVVSGILGAPVCNGDSFITVVDTTHFVMNSLAFSGAYSSGGQAVLDNTIRTGTGFAITNAAFSEITDSFEYGYHTGALTGTGCVWCEFKGVGLDANLSDADANSIGLLISGNADRTHWTGGYFSSYGASIDNNTTQARPSTIIGASIGATGPNGLYLQSGALQIFGGDITGGSGPITFVGTGPTLSLIGVSNGVTFNYTGGATSAQLIVNTQIGVNCSGSPTSSFATIGGLVTHC